MVGRSYDEVTQSTVPFTVTCVPGSLTLLGSSMWATNTDQAVGKQIGVTWKILWNGLGRES